MNWLFKKMQTVYLVTYAHSTGLSYGQSVGFGNIIVTVRKPITEASTVREIEQYISGNNNMEKIVILNYIKLREEPLTE